MRVGNNPLKNNAVAASILPVAICAVTHLPNLQGYHARRLEIVQVSLLSMRKFAGMDASIVIWDNGSCEELTDWIEQEYKPDIFIRSINMGKATARTALFRMMPPKTIVACSDDDMLFYPNWLQPQIDLLKGFPNVSCVTGYPVRTSFRWGNQKTAKWAKKNASVQIGKFIPKLWEYDFAVSIGREPREHEQMTEADQDVMIEYNGLKAYATSHHCQFIGYADKVGQVVQYDGLAMSDERPFDIALDTIGLRLSTIDRLSRHMGNVIHDELREEITRLRL